MLGSIGLVLLNLTRYTTDNNRWQEEIMPTQEDLIDEFVGRKARYSTSDGFQIEVTVENVKAHFGRVDVEVTPVHGSGTKWISNSKLQFLGVSRNGSEPESGNKDIW